MSLMNKESYANFDLNPNKTFNENFKEPNNNLIASISRFENKSPQFRKKFVKKIILDNIKSSEIIEPSQLFENPKIAKKKKKKHRSVVATSIRKPEKEDNFKVLKMELNKNHNKVKDILFNLSKCQKEAEFTRKNFYRDEFVAKKLRKQKYDNDDEEYEESELIN